MKNKNILVLIIAVSIIFAFVSGISAQRYDDKKGGGKPDPQLSQEDNDYLDRQAKFFLDTVQSIIAKYPPSANENRERGFAKLLLDAVFHEHFAAFRKPVQEYFHQCIGKVIDDLETTQTKKGAQVWKIYDMGFIVRTASVTIAFDLVSGITSGSEDFAMNEQEKERLVKQCDALFITHRHEDHAEKAIAEKFLMQGKPVFAPDQVWKNDSVFAKITHLERNANKKQIIDLKGKKLEVVVFPGHQMKNIDNNVYLVKTSEGITVAHLGDQINEGDFMVDFEWIDKVAENHKVDIMMPAAWTMDIMRIAKGFNPKLVLPGHELEMGHTVWDRLPFWGDDEYLKLNYNKLKTSGYPVVVLTWGESFIYPTH
ncbi:MAG TPA: MBL fold metallo-hydrolase [Draconibacterium sp.]|nr:MBL fold metallo-hydrolase [Draconibacterium sp.]